MNILGGPLFCLPQPLPNLAVYFDFFIWTITGRDAISRQILILEQHISPFLFAQGAVMFMFLSNHTGRRRGAYTYSLIR